MTERSTAAARVGAHQRGPWVALAVLLLTAAFVAFTLNSMESSNRQLTQGQQAQATVIAKLATGLDTTRKQLKQHGVTPKAPAASSIVKGVRRTRRPGTGGSDGCSGHGRQPRTVRRTGPERQKRFARHRGLTWPGRTLGRTRRQRYRSAGRGGSNRTGRTPGPQGRHTGRQGPKGDTGDTGPTGPAPSGWSFTYPPGALGVTYNCTPDGAGSTHYSCAPASGAAEVQLARQGCDRRGRAARHGRLSAPRPHRTPHRLRPRRRPRSLCCLTAAERAPLSCPGPPAAPLCRSSIGRLLILNQLQWSMPIDGASVHLPVHLQHCSGIVKLPLSERESFGPHRIRARQHRRTEHTAPEVGPGRRRMHPNLRGEDQRQDQPRQAPRTIQGAGLDARGRHALRAGSRPPRPQPAGWPPPDGTPRQAEDPLARPQGHRSRRPLSGGAPEAQPAVGLDAEAGHAVLADSAARTSAARRRAASKPPGGPAGSSAGGR